MTDDEFRSGSRATFTIEADAELSAVIDQWSENIPTLYFLDICVVNVTKLNQEALKGNARKRKLVDYLKRFDKNHNSFSYLFALIEKVNDPRGKLTDIELQEEILRDIAALRAFFVNAVIRETDEYIINFAQTLRGTAHEQKHSDYIRFLRIANDRFKLGNAVAKSLRLQKAEEILKEADGLNIARHHPVVLVTLACLYGNSSAKKVMKFKDDATQFNAENALADIMIIVRFLPIMLELEQMGSKGIVNFKRSSFITDDDGLSRILDCFEGEAVKIEPIDGAHRIITSSRINFGSLFPELPALPESEMEEAERGEPKELSEYEKLLELLEPVTFR